MSLDRQWSTVFSIAFIVFLCDFERKNRPEISNLTLESITGRRHQNTSCFIYFSCIQTKSLYWFSGANVAVTGAGLTPVLEQEGPFTVFLPTTEAFAAIDNATVSSFIQNITLLQRKLRGREDSTTSQLIAVGLDFFFFLTQ